MLAALVWGFAEATLFFFVPDVLLSFVALRGVRRGLLACGVVTVGALVGGALMYAWGHRDPSGALAALDMVPAVGGEMIGRVERDLGDRWGVALVTGAFAGTPYKIFAVQAGRLGIPPVGFLLASIPARLLRFVLVTLVFGWVSGRLSWSDRRKVQVVAAIWLVFYALFLGLMPG